MAVTVRLLSAVTSSAVNTGTDQISASTGNLAEGEAVLAWVNGDDTGAVLAGITPVQAGWTQIDGVTIQSGVPDKIFHRPAIVGTPPASYQFNVDGDFGTLMLFAVNGSAGTPTFDVGDMANGSSASITAPSVAVANDGSAVVRGWSLSPRGSAGRSIAEPAGGTVLRNDLNDDDFVIKSAKVFPDDAGASGTSVATASHSHPWSAFTAVFYEDAPAAEPNEVAATIPLELAAAAASSVGHDASAEIGLQVDADASTAAAHRVTDTVPLTAALAVTAHAEHHVAAAIPLTLDAAAVTGAEHQAATALPLTLDPDAATAADRNATAAIPLTLTAAPVAEVPAPPGEVTATIPLTLALAPHAAADHDAQTALPLHLDTDAEAAVPAVVELTDHATWVETARPARFTATTRTSRFAGDTAPPDRFTGTPRPTPIAGDTAEPERFTGTPRPTPFAGATETPDRFTGTERPDRFGGDTTAPDRFTGTPRAHRFPPPTAAPDRFVAPSNRPPRFAATTGPPQFVGTSARPDRWSGTIRPGRFHQTTFHREGDTMALNFVDIGPYTENEIPEALVVRWLRTHADESTSGMPLHGQTPAWTVDVHISQPSGSVVTRAAEILDPATLTTEFPEAGDQGGDGVTDGEDGWVRVAFAAGDLDEVTAGAEYGIQLVADNGTLLLKTSDVWRPEVNAGPASAAVLA